ncbi:uncharacterized protein METZ01_LOCUS113324, partial [marine metagenome]
WSGRADVRANDPSYSSRGSGRWLCDHFYRFGESRSAWAGNTAIRGGNRLDVCCLETGQYAGSDCGDLGETGL